MLADHGLDRELAYTALTRGRHTNHLYVSREAGSVRDEFAPVDVHRGDIGRLTAALGASSARTLAIDTGRGVDLTRATDRIAEAERAHARALGRRREMEARRAHWLPGRRGRLARLRRIETAAARRLRDLRRESLELEHGSRAFVTERELDAAFDKTADRVAERRLEREFDRGPERHRRTELGR